MNTVYILLGGNLGDRSENLRKARLLICDRIGKMVLSSSVYQTAAWGVENQPDFYNQVCCVETKFTVHKVLDSLQSIEIELGRKRYQKWHERNIDLDILYFNREIISEEDLKVPHPFLHERRFTLIPLVEVSKDFKHPKYQKTNAELLSSCKDELEVKKLELIS